MKIISESENCVEVELPSGDVTKISPEDKRFMEIFPSWAMAGNYVKCFRYIRTEYSSVQEGVYLHRLIVNSTLGIKRGREIDHINRDKLDNRRVNLRTCTRSENMMNGSGVYKGKSSQFRGVTYNPRLRAKPYRAQIGINRKVKCIGYYSDEKEAALAYDRVCKEVFGEFAVLNFPLKDETTPA